MISICIHYRPDTSINICLEFILSLEKNLFDKLERVKIRVTVLIIYASITVNLSFDSYKEDLKRNN
jgi:hypothetical protein